MCHNIQLQWHVFLLATIWFLTPCPHENIATCHYVIIAAAHAYTFDSTSYFVTVAQTY